jgi:ferrous iron transport protein A
MTEKIWFDDGQNCVKFPESTYLRDFSVGTKGRIVGYERSFLGYQGKLLSMGLIPGKEFTVIRHASFNNPVEIDIQGFKLSLRKQEADALCVEEVSYD